MIYASTNMNMPYSLKCDVTTLIPSVTAPAYVKKEYMRIMKYFVPITQKGLHMQYTRRYSKALTMKCTYFFFSSFQNSNFISSSAM